MQFLSYLTSWTALVVVHESVPHTPPLPDLVLDRLALREAAADLADVLVMLASPIAVVTFIMHKHRQGCQKATRLLAVLYVQFNHRDLIKRKTPSKR